MSKKICEKCNSFDGTCCQSGFAFPYDIDCSDSHCDYFEEKSKTTFFQQITQSPDVLAEEFIHLEYDRSKDECGFTSQYLEEIFIIKEQEGKDHEEKYFNARNKAIAATVAKLKEVVK